MQRAGMLLLLLVLFLFSSCTAPRETETSTEIQTSVEDSIHLIKMPVSSVRNAAEITEPEYSQSMLNRFEAEAALPESRKTVNKKTEDVTPLSVYNRSFTQLFIYGDGASTTGLNADFLFFVRGGKLARVFTAQELGVDAEGFVIDALYAADLNKDDIYELYLNAHTGDGKHFTVGIDLADDSVIAADFQGNHYMHTFEDRLFWIQIPKGGTTAQAACVSPVLANRALTANENTSQQMALAALSSWKLNQ